MGEPTWRVGVETGVACLLCIWRGGVGGPESTAGAVGEVFPEEDVEELADTSSVGDCDLEDGVVSIAGGRGGAACG